MESCNRNCFDAFATAVTVATQQMNALVDETCGCERVFGSLLSNMRRGSVSM